MRGQTERGSVAVSSPWTAEHADWEHWNSNYFGSEIGNGPSVPDGIVDIAADIAGDVAGGAGVVAVVAVVAEPAWEECEEWPPELEPA